MNKENVVYTMKYYSAIKNGICSLEENGWDWQLLQKVSLTKTSIIYFFSCVEFRRKRDMEVKGGLLGMWKERRNRRGW
jgi:hypothetical protein